MAVGYPYVLNRDFLDLIAVPVYNGASLYQSYLVVNSSDKSTKTIKDLGQTVFAYSDPLSNSGFLVPRHILMLRQHNINIGERTAERIKIEVGAALQELENPPADFAVHGRDMMTGIPKEITVSYQEIAYAIDKTISKIEAAIHSALEMTPPELSADIFKTGIYLAGGGALLRGLDKRISMKTKLPVHIAEDPLRAVARGTGLALKNTDRYPFLIR